MSYLKEIENLTNLIKNDPTNFQARRELTVALMDKGFNEEAIKQLSYLISVFPEDARLHYNLGIAWDKIRNFKQALKAYETALSYEPEEPDFLYNLGSIPGSRNIPLNFLISNPDKYLNKNEEYYQLA